MRLIIGAGGTGGHIIPAIAVANELYSKGWEIVFIGNMESMEERLISQYPYKFMVIKVQKLYRKLTLQHIRFPYVLFMSIVKSIKYMRDNKPQCVLCTGGFVSGPVAIASIVMHIPLFFQDGNSYPGLTTRLLAVKAKRVFIADLNAKNYLPQLKCQLTGNPLLNYVAINKEKIEWSSYNLTADKKKVLIFGGSQGSVIINKIVAECVGVFLEWGIEIIWQTGKISFHEISETYKNTTGVHIFDFSTKMSVYYQMADIAVSRAGALSIAELNEHKVPTLFIPLPTAADNHQYKNAKAQADNKLGLLLEQRNLKFESLTKSVKALLDGYLTFKNNLDSLPPNKAASEIAEYLEKTVSNYKEH